MEHKEKIAIICVVGMLALNSFQLYQLQQDVNHLQEDTQNNIQSLRNDVRNVNSAISGQEHNIQELLTKQASLFSKTSLNYALQGNQLAVTMQAIPKELKNNETLIARITANGKTYQQTMDADHQATLLIDPVEPIQPSLIIQSANGVRQEALQEEYPLQYLIIPLDSGWEDTKLDIYLTPQQATLPLQAKDIAKVECIVVNGGAMEIVNSRTPESAAEQAVPAPTAQMEAGKIPEGDVVAAVSINEDSPLHYQADFSDYLERKDQILYEIYLVVTSKDGMTFASNQPIASHWSRKNNNSWGHSGSGELYPVLE